MMMPQWTQCIEKESPSHGRIVHASVSEHGMYQLCKAVMGCTGLSPEDVVVKTRMRLFTLGSEGVVTSSEFRAARLTALLTRGLGISVERATAAAAVKSDLCELRDVVEGAFRSLLAKGGPEVVRTLDAEGVDVHIKDLILSYVSLSETGKSNACVVVQWTSSARDRPSERAWRGATLTAMPIVGQGTKRPLTEATSPYTPANGK
jgi:hypothetical protein